MPWLPAPGRERERERSPLKKLAKRRPEPQAEAPRRIPWPDYAPEAESGLTEAQAPLSPPGTTRKDVPGSTAFVPSVAGLILAGEVIKDIAGVR